MPAQSPAQGRAAAVQGLEPGTPSLSLHRAAPLRTEQEREQVLALGGDQVMRGWCEVQKKPAEGLPSCGEAGTRELVQLIQGVRVHACPALGHLGFTAEEQREG